MDGNQNFKIIAVEGNLFSEGILEHRQDVCAQFPQQISWQTLHPGLWKYHARLVRPAPIQDKTTKRQLIQFCSIYWINYFKLACCLKKQC